MYDYNYGYDYVNPGFSTPGAEGTADLLGDILGGIAAVGIVTMLLSLAVTILLIISNWKIFEKGKRNGWESLVPVHNIFVLLEIAGTPTWHIFLFFVPFANIYAIFKMFIDLAHKFGKSTGFGVATVFFSFVCLPILAFSKNVKYDSKEEEKTSVESDNNNVNENPINQNIVSYEQTPTVMNVEPTVAVQPEPVLMPIQPVVETPQLIEPANVETSMFTPNTNVVENGTNVQTPEVKPIQPMYNEPTPMQNVVSEPVTPVQYETPVQNVMPEPTVSNTYVMPEQNNNNQTGQMM